MSDARLGALERTPDFSFRLRELPAMIRRRRWWLGTSLVVTLVLGVLYLRWVTPAYEVAARLLVQEQGVTSKQPDDFLATQAQIIRSPVIVGDVMASLPEGSPYRPEVVPVEVVLRLLSVNPIADTNVLSLHFRSEQPAEALQFVQRIVSRYQDYTKQEALRLLGTLNDTAKIQDELWKAQVRAKELTQSYGARHPEVRAVEDQIAHWENVVAERLATDHQMAERLASETVRVLEPPAVSEKPVWPRPLLVAVLFATIGLIGGMTLVVLAEGLDPKLRSSEQVAAVVHLPVLGHIPWFSTRTWGSGGNRLPAAQDSPVADAFRVLRTRLQLALDAPRGVVVQIASPEAGEGKTTVTANLAASFAQLGHRVVVVDADLRRGALHLAFDVTSSPGLAGVLERGVPLEQAVVRSSRAAVDVLPRGLNVSNAAELLARREFAQMLDTLRAHYDLILLDTPPLLAVSDATALTASVDGVLVVLMAGKSKLAGAVRCREILESLEVPTLGVVVNGVQGGTPHGYPARPYTSRPAPPRRTAATEATVTHAGHAAEPVQQSAAAGNAGARRAAAVPAAPITQVQPEPQTPAAAAEVERLGAKSAERDRRPAATANRNGDAPLAFASPVPAPFTPLVPAAPSSGIASAAGQFVIRVFFILPLAVASAVGVGVLVVMMLKYLTNQTP